MATKYFFPEWATVHVRVTLCVNILNFVFFHPQPWSPTFVLTDPLCVAPEPGFTHSSVNGRINNNSPARIAFPGWVSLALAAGAAAARLRAPTEGLNTPPRSCMITNLLPSLFFFTLVAVCALQKADRGAARKARVRGWCLFLRTRTEVPAAPSVDNRADQWRRPSKNFGMFYVRRLCLVTMATLCRDSREVTMLPGEEADSRNTREVSV